MAFEPLPLKRDQAKYTLESQLLPVRSASIAVLSWNTPSRLGADDPLATTCEPTKRLPSLKVLPASPSGLSKTATHSSPKVFLVPAGSSELSEPMKTLPCRSHAMTGSPADAVRMCARAA